MECMDEMFKIENIQYKCEKCNNTDHNRMDKKLLTKPKTLIIKLKRYTNIGTSLVKVNKLIRYYETLNLEKYYCGINISNYHLYGVINHIGSLNGGHYYSYVKDYITHDGEKQFGNTWYCCNDTNVREISLNDVLNSNNAYMLFYHSDN